MARRAKMNDGDSGASKTVSADDLKEAVAEIRRQKNLASEYAGNAGKATQNAVERHGLEKTALTFTRRLSDMEEGKRGGVIRASIDYWAKMGFFDQIDAFDDIHATLSDVLNRAHNARPQKRGAEDSSLNDHLTN